MRVSTGVGGVVAFVVGCFVFVLGVFVLVVDGCRFWLLVLSCFVLFQVDAAVGVGLVLVRCFVAVGAVLVVAVGGGGYLFHGKYGCSRFNARVQSRAGISWGCTFMFTRLNHLRRF